MTQLASAPREDREDPTGSVSQPAPPARPGLVAAVTRAYGPLLVAAALLVGYSFAFQLTKPSPLSVAQTGDLVPVVAYGVLLAVGMSLLLLPLGLALNVVGRWRGVPSLGTVAATALLYAVLVLAFVENLLYSSQGSGLKTTDGVLLKVVFGVLAFATGILLARRAVAARQRTLQVAVLFTLVATVLSVVVVGRHLASLEDPAAPRALANPNLLNVVILSSDGIDASRMSAYGYSRETTPFLEQKASEFQVFENAFTNNGNTTGSITSLLNGAAPRDTGVVYPPDVLDANEAQRTLPRLLGELGYYRSNWAVPHYADAHDQNLVEAFQVDNGYRDAESPVTLLPLGTGPARWFVQETVEGSAALVGDVLGVREMTNPYSQVSHIVGDTLSDQDRLDSVVEEIREESRPLFINTHFMVTHGPAFTIADPHFSARDGEQKSAWEKNFYDDSLRQFDSYVEEVYAALEESGRLDDTILVVTSDHGIEYDATKRVPLMIRFPGQEHAGRVSTNVQRLDVAPTVLEAIGIEQPEWMTGQSLLDPGAIPADRQILATTTATRVFPNHFGFRPADGDLLLTVIRCGRYTTVQPSGDHVSGNVRGSTAECTAEPDPASVD